MAEISTVAVITATPGAGDRLEEVLRRLAEASHQEAGCLLYSLQRGLRDGDVFVTVEKWESLADLEAHLASGHVASALSEAGDLLAEPPRIVPARPLTVGMPAKSAY